MKKELRDEWVKKLRDPTSKQVDGVLERVLGDEVVGNCCLGVLANICGVSKVPLKNGSCMSFEFEDGLRSYVPPKGWNGMDMKTLNTIAELNDKAGLTFPQIADWIEANIEVE